MSGAIESSSIGSGAPERDLSRDDLAEIVEEALARVPRGARVLAIVPDRTRDDSTDVLFPLAAEALAARGAARLDALVAQGTHMPMTDAQKRAKLGLSNREAPLPVAIFDHGWDRPADLVTIGRLDAEQVRELSGGLLAEDVPLTVNRLLAPGAYDLVLVFGATVPHEVAGYSGGAKYFFPGVAGPELTHVTHWLGALVSVEKTIGRVETPTRRLIEAAAAHVPIPAVSFNSVVTHDADGRLRTCALFAGDVRASFRRAAAVSARTHVRYTGRTYRRVLALLDEHYDELWVGGKASYKLGGIVEDGGELVIYAPHMRSISETHGPVIERYGYAPIETVRTWVAESPELRGNLCVAAHLAHVAYAGRYDAHGGIIPKFRITLASGIDRARCERVGLGFADYGAIDRAEFDADPNALVVERAGQELYLVAPDE